MKTIGRTSSDDEDVVRLAVDGAHLWVDGEPSELVSERGVRQERQPVERRHGLVHQRVRLDEVERDLGQGARVVDTLAGTRLGHVVDAHRQPVRVHRRLRLFKERERQYSALYNERRLRRGRGTHLESAIKRVHDVLQSERADGRAVNRVFRRGEHAVDEPLRAAPVSAFHHVAHRFCNSKRGTVNTH